MKLACEILAYLYLYVYIAESRTGFDATESGRLVVVLLDRVFELFDLLGAHYFVAEVVPV